jgi:hypothetical protein
LLAEMAETDLRTYYELAQTKLVVVGAEVELDNHLAERMAQAEQAVVVEETTEADLLLLELQTLVEGVLVEMN